MDRITKDLTISSLKACIEYMNKNEKFKADLYEIVGIVGSGSGSGIIQLLDLFHEVFKQYDCVDYKEARVDLFNDLKCMMEKNKKGVFNDLSEVGSTFYLLSELVKKIVDLDKKHKIREKF